MLKDTVLTKTHQPPARSDPPPRRVQWTEQQLAQTVERLQQQVDGPYGGEPGASQDREVVTEIVRLGMEPEILGALRERLDPDEAIQDLVAGYAFAKLYSREPLDRLSQASIARVLDLIHAHAGKIAQRTGDNPLDEVPDLLHTICERLGQYVPRKPMSAHIRWKLRHYESPVSRAMRQIENLVKRSEVTEAFAVYVTGARADARLKAQLLQLARGGGRHHMDFGAVIRFFARPETVAFVKQFARTVQTARTLYDEVEYRGIPWRGRRRLPKKRRQGYMSTALARIERQDDESLDNCDRQDADIEDLHEVVADPNVCFDTISLHTECFEAWVTEHACAQAPDDPIWQACHWLYIEQLSTEEIIARDLAGAETITAAVRRIETLRSTPEVWAAWMEKTLLS